MHLSGDFPSSWGSTLPPEVLDGIIQCFASRRCDIVGNCYYDSQCSVHMDKRQLAACSLVCRYWFQRCRPHILGNPKLRSSKDIDDLLAILRHVLTGRFPLPSPLPFIADAIEELVVVQSGEWAKPWLHDVTRVYNTPQHRILRPRINSLRVIIEDAYILDSSSPPGSKYAPSSMSAYLPRTLPGIFFQFIDFDLVNLCFRRPLDLIRLLNDIPTVYRISLNKISFTQGVETPLPQRTWRPHPNLVSVSAFECGGHLLEAQLLFLFLLSRVRRGDEAPGILLDAGPALQDIASSCAMSNAVAPTVKMTRRASWIEFTSYKSETVSTHHIQYSVEAAALEDASVPESSPSYEPSFTFTLCSQLNLEDVKSWDWKTIDEVLCTLHPRPFIEFLTSDPATFKWFLCGIREGVLLKGSKETGNLDVHFPRDDTSGEILCSLEDIQLVPAGYIVDGKEVKLDIGQRFDIWRCPDGEKEAFLRGLVAKTNQSQMSMTGPAS